jgi:pyruvate carboxylase subunit B
MKRINYLDTSFRDGFQSCYGARVKTADFLPALKAAVEAGTRRFEIGGGARFQSLYFYCQEDAFEMMDACRAVVGPEIDLQSLSRGANVVGLISQSRDIIDLHAKMFKRHGVSTIRNFDALNDVRNLDHSGRCIHRHGLRHQVSVTLMALPPGSDGGYAHSPQFYLDALRKILDAGIPFDSVCFKDASGTATPQTVFATIQGAKQMLPSEIEVEFHTHSTAGLGESCYMAAIEAGVDTIDLCMRPVSGGTGAPDILTMWHRLKGTDYTLDIDYEKILVAEETFVACMEKYFMPPEALETNPWITLSPMPGGALTANTQMMRDNNCLNLFPQVIKEMREVVERGGFGTSVTPVSQFYFQQAFNNTVQGKWKKIADGYGKMVLGYFGRTPSAPDPEIVKIAAEQLGLQPTVEDVHDINDRNPKLGVKAMTAKLQAAGLPVTDENIFIAATCEDKGIEFLQGKKPLGIRYVDAPKKEAAPAARASAKGAPEVKSAGDGNYRVTVDGKAYQVHVAPGGTAGVAPAASAAPAPLPPASGGNRISLTAPLPGTVLRLVATVGDAVAAGETVLVLEAMKMETMIRAEGAGVITEIIVAQGDTVASGDLLAILEAR